jgi:two-component system response regulator YesN
MIQMRIVIIEDELRTRKSLIKLIGRISQSYTVVGEAGDGDEGLRIIARTNPDLIITDIKMPNFDGLEMIRRLKNENVSSKVIILSGYAEFNYAQQAVKLGVDEYLLKPITVNELIKSLQNIEQVIKKEEKSQTELAPFGRTGWLLEKMLLQNDAVSVEDCAELQRQLGGGDELHYSLIVIRFNSTLNILEQEKLIKEIGILTTEVTFGESKRVMVKIDREVVLLANREQFLKILAKLKNLDDSGYNEQFMIGYSEIGSLDAVHKVYSKIKDNFKWSIVFKDGSVISAAEIERLEPEKLIYPKDIEVEIVKRIQTANFKCIFNEIDAFFDQLRANIFNPDDLREAVTKLLGAILFVARQEDPERYGKISNSRIMRELDECNYMGSMINIFKSLVGEIMVFDLKRPEQPYSLTVGKTLSIIHQEYSSDLSLECIAERLHITPEYLSSVFAREVGQKWISYLTEYRINKSKELLWSKKYKIYEIARMVGYSDVKYYCKVFKKVTGYSTGDFLKMRA